MTYKYTSEITIRRIEVEDVEACKSILLAPPHILPESFHLQEPLFLTERQSGLVAIKNGEVAGFVIIQPHFERAAEIVWMAVTPTARRQGIGRSIIQHLRQDLINGGYHLLHVFILLPAEKNWQEMEEYKSIQEFSQTAGFQQINELVSLQSEQQVIMLAMHLG